MPAIYLCIFGTLKKLVKNGFAPPAFTCKSETCKIKSERLKPPPNSPQSLKKYSVL